MTHKKYHLMSHYLLFFSDGVVLGSAIDRFELFPRAKDRGGLYQACDKVRLPVLCRGEGLRPVADPLFLVWGHPRQSAPTGVGRPAGKNAIVHL